MGVRIGTGILMGIAAVALLRRRWAGNQPHSSALQVERRRIARELHDIVGHGMLVIAMQARQLGTAMPVAAPAAEAIEGVARSTMRDVREMIGLLRAAPRPRPLSVRVRELVDRLPPDADPVTVAVRGIEPALPAEVSDAALHVVQEGLTNGFKHGGGRSTRVELRFGVELRVAVITAGPARPWRAPGTGACAGAGLGLAGLGERVREQHGIFQAGPLAGGGFLMRARFPVP
jgi:signal transduction histidine kinase